MQENTGSAHVGVARRQNYLTFIIWKGGPHANDNLLRLETANEAGKEVRHNEIVEDSIDDLAIFIDITGNTRNDRRGVASS